MIKQFTREGVGCEYDSALWRPMMTFGSYELRWIGGNKRCDLPKGLKSCKGMFKGCSLDKGFYFGDFDTGEVTDMSHMFEECTMPPEFSLGNSFRTSNVKDMESMFRKCYMSDEFSLGNNFDTSKVYNMASMFCMCHFPSEFSLGKYFDTRNVVSMRAMFNGCELPEGFSLGKHFNTSNVEGMELMFSNTKFPSGFELPDSFDTSKVKHMPYMFENASLNRGFTVPATFTLQSVSNAIDMFTDCKLDGMWLENTFPAAVLHGLTRKTSSSPKYLFAKLHDVPYEILEECKSVTDLERVIDAYCRMDDGGDTIDVKA